MQRATVYRERLSCFASFVNQTFLTFHLASRAQRRDSHIEARGCAVVTVQRADPTDAMTGGGVLTHIIRQ